jgi:hypothetical protein
MSLLDTLLTAYMYENQKNSDPKITTAPSTPGEQFLLSNFQNALNNPSPTRQMATTAASQALGNMSSFNPSSFNFVSPLMKGQTFAGGMKIPGFDFSKIDMTKGFGTSPTTTGTSGAPPSSPSLPTGSVNGNGPAGVDLGGMTIGGVPAAPSINDPNPTTGTDIMNSLGKNASQVAMILKMLGVPDGMATALQSYLAAHLAQNMGQNLSPLPSPTLNNWSNSQAPPIFPNSSQPQQTPPTNPADWANYNYPQIISPAEGGDNGELPTKTPTIPNLTPKPKT